jgi:metal-sulfur cluster biosynthetic enzyme
MDTVISVYNEDGIKAACLFDIKKVYTLELAIALKQLGLSVNDHAKFAYNIRLNGAKAVVVTFTPTASSTPQEVAIFEKMNAQQNAYAGRLTAPTDFWGEYILAKK